MMNETVQVERRRTLAETRDPRAFVTRAKLTDALRVALETSDRSEVTVANIAKRAGVSRSTFYTHFATIEELVIVAADTLFAELAPLDVQRRTEHGLSRADITRLGLRELLDRIAPHAELFVFATSFPSASSLRTRFTNMMSSSLRATIELEMPDASGRAVAQMADFIAAGCTRVIIDWLDDPRGQDAAALIEVLASALPDWLTKD